MKKIKLNANLGDELEIVVGKKNVYFKPLIDNTGNTFIISREKLNELVWR